MAYLEKALGQDVVNFEVKIYIEDDGIDSGASARAKEWVDFSDKAESSGKNLLKQLGVVSQQTETRSGVGAFASTIRQISLSNVDGFFNRPINRKSGAVVADFYGSSYPSELKTTLGNTAFFTYTHGYTLTVYGGRKIRIDARVQLSDGSVSSGTLGVFLIDSTNRSSSESTFVLTSLTQPLIERDASGILNGLSPYSNRSIGFLTEEILKQEYADSNGDLPSNFAIEKNIRIQTSDSITGLDADNRTISQYGRPPERTFGTEVAFRAATNSGNDNGSSWVNEGLTTRAIINWDFGTNPDFGNITCVAVTDNASTVHLEILGADLDIDAEWGATALRPVPGDILRIKNSLNNNDGFYQINNVTESDNRTVISFTTPLKGSTEDAMEFNVSRIYMGCDDNVYIFRPDRDLFSSVDTSTLETVRASISNLPTTYKMNVHRLWFDSLQMCIVGAAWHEQYFPGAGTSGDWRIYSPGTSMQIFKVAYSATNDVLSTVGSVIDDVLTGEHCVRRADTTNGLAGHLGQVSGTSFESTSENVCLPFKQKTIGAPYKANIGGQRGEGSVAYLLDDTDAVVTVSSLTETFAFDVVDHHESKSRLLDMPKSYTTVYIGDESSTATPRENSIFRYSMGQNGFVVFNQRSEVAGAIFYCVYDFNATSDEFFKYYHFSVNLGTSRIISNGNGYKIDSLAVHPTTGCEILGEKSVAVGLMGWKDDSGSGVAGECRSYIQVLYQVTGETGGVIGTYRFLDSPAYSSDTDSNSEFYRTFTDMIPFYATVGHNRACKLLVSGIHRNKLGLPDNYFLGFYEYDGSTPSDVITNRKSSNTPMSKLIFDDTASNPTHSSYFVDVETGVLWHYLFDTTHSFTALDGGHPITEGDPNLNSNLILDTSSMKDSHSSEGNRVIVYGVSAPFYPSMLQLNPITGKQYLWKYDVYYTSRIELADFDGLSLWDVLKLFSEKTGYMMGWDGDSFFFVSRDISETVSHTFNNSGTGTGYVNISLSDGIREIYNVASIIPSVVKLEQPSTELRLAADPDDNIDRSKMQAELVTEQRDTQTKNIKLQCVTGGSLDSNQLSFKYIYYSRNIETTLSSAYGITDTQLFISTGISDIRQGDLLEVRTQQKASGTQTEEFVGTGSCKADPSSDEISSGIIRLAAALTNFNVTDFAVVSDPTNYPIGSSVLITKSNSNKWSDGVDNKIANGDFITALSDAWSTVGCIETLSTATFVIGANSLQITTSTASSEYVTQTVTLAANTPYAISGSAKVFGGTGSVAQTAYLDIVGTAVDWSTVQITSRSWEKFNGYFTTTTNTSVDIRLYSDNTNPVYFDNLVLSEGFKSRPTYFRPYNNDTFYEIGDSAVYLKIIDGNIGTVEVSEWLIGDIIIINCLGLVLTQDKLSKQTTINATSVKNYGRREYPSVTNRFLSYKEAKDMTKKIVFNYANPHLLARITSNFAPYIKFINRSRQLGAFKLIDEELLPLAKASGLVGYMRKVDHNPSNGVTTIIIRDSEPY